MPVPPYLQDPQRLAARMLGVAPPLREILAETEVIQQARRVLTTVVEEGKLILPSRLYEAVLAYHSALAIAAISGKPALLRKLIDSTVLHAMATFRKLDQEELESIAKILGLRLRKTEALIPWLVDPTGTTIPLRLEYTVPLEDYLNAIEGAPGSELRLPNAFLKQGKVYLDRGRLVALLAYKIKVRILSLAEEYRSLDAPRLREEALRVIAELETGETLDRDKLPECIKSMIGRDKLSDRQAYIIISFLASVKPDLRAIEEILLLTGLAGPKSAENLAAAIASLGREYTPYRCDTEEAREACGDKCRGSILREYYRRLHGGSTKSRGQGQM